VLAAIEAVLEPEFNLHGIGATTMGATPTLIVNGEAVKESGVSSSYGCVGSSGNRANITVGRAVKLFCQNVGGARLGVSECTTLGAPMKISCCIAEREEVLSGAWRPLNVQQGQRPGTGSVTVAACMCTQLQLSTLDASGPELLRLLGAQLAQLYMAPAPLISFAVLVLAPETYQLILNAGFTSKEAVAKKILAEAKKHQLFEWPTMLAYVARKKGVKAKLAMHFIAGAAFCLLGRLSRLPHLGLLGALTGSILGATGLGYLLMGVGCLCRLFGLPIPVPAKIKSPENLMTIVAGGEAGRFAMLMPGFGAADMNNVTKAVTKPVLPAVQPGSLQSIGAPDAILDPTGFMDIERLKRVPRVSLATGTPRVGLFDISKGQGREFLDHLQARLIKEYPNAEVERFIKPTFTKPAPDELREEITKKCTHVIGVLAD